MHKSITKLLEPKQRVTLDFAHVTPIRASVADALIELIEMLPLAGKKTFSELCLGIEERVVREIRCVAEREYYPVDEWERALEFKDRACKGYAEYGVAYATKKYIDRARAAKARGSN